MTDLVAELDRLHEEAVQGKCEMGLNLDYCTKHARRKKPGLGSCGPRKASLMKYAAEMQEAWPTISARVKALDEIAMFRICTGCGCRGELCDTYGRERCVACCPDCKHLDSALDVTP